MALAFAAFWIMVGGLGIASAVGIASAAAENPNSVAVIIGNKSYAGSAIPDVQFAHRDADAFKRYVIEVLGYRPGNVIDLRDASKGALEAAFGNTASHKGQLFDYLRPDRRGDVVVFYSGHGVPGQEDRRGYLLPVDANPDRPQLTGYPLDVLYENLGKLPARNIRVFIDACFSGQSAGGSLLRSSSGMNVVAEPAHRPPNITVLTAAAANQVASWDHEARYGLFTRYVLEGLQGAADSSGAGNGDGNVALAELRDYLDREMTYAARRRFGRNQTASLRGDPGTVLGPVPAVAPVLLAPGPAPEIVREAQTLLRELGYNPGPADGAIGPSTEAAVTAFRRTAGLAPGRQIDAPLLEALRAHRKRIATRAVPVPPAGAVVDSSQPRADSIALSLERPAGASIEIAGRRFAVEPGLVLYLSKGKTPFTVSVPNRRPLFGLFEVMEVDKETSRALFGLNNPLFKPRHIDAALQGAPVSYSLGLSSRGSRRPVVRYNLSARPVFGASR